MNDQDFMPPINVVADFQALLSSIQADKEGDTSRGLIKYFREAEIKSLELKLRSDDFEQQELGRLLNEAFGASARIVAAAWQKAHGTELYV